MAQWLAQESYTFKVMSSSLILPTKLLNIVGSSPTGTTKEYCFERKRFYAAVNKTSPNIQGKYRLITIFSYKDKCLVMK